MRLTENLKSVFRLKKNERIPIFDIGDSSDERMTGGDCTTVVCTFR